MASTIDDRAHSPSARLVKKNRDSQGQWVPIEIYITEHSEAVFSHGYCPNCAQSFQNKMETMRLEHESLHLPLSVLLPNRQE